jgi:hypothetical protein
MRRHQSASDPISEKFYLPCSWVRGDEKVLSFCEWYFERYSGVREPAVFSLLRTMQGMIDLGLVRLDREICLHAFATADLPYWLTSHHITIHDNEVTSNTAQKILDRTGLRFEVQAILLSQVRVLKALVEGVNMIEKFNLLDFAFVCHRGTDCSPGGILLLAMLLYPRAKLVLHTERVVHDADLLLRGAMSH